MHRSAGVNVSVLGSEHIPGKIFLSVHTINRHHRNIPNKTFMETMPELISKLMGRRECIKTSTAETDCLQGESVQKFYQVTNLDE